MTPTITIPKQLMNEEFRFCLVSKGEKKPFENGWSNKTNYQYNDPILTNHLTSGGNYGVLGGRGNLLIIDFDSEEYQNEIFPKLPETFTVKSGGRGLYHAYFYCDDSSSWVIKDEDGKTKADIICKGKQAVAPNSINAKTGNSYTIVSDKDIASIKLDELKEILGENKDTSSVSVGNIKSLLWSFLDECEYEVSKRRELGKVKDEKDIFKWINSNLEVEDQRVVKKKIIELKRDPKKALKAHAKLDARFFKPELMDDIYLELDKHHQLDDTEKMAVFIICVSSLLPDSNDHCSVALKGNSSAGKDNIVKTCLRHFPDDSSFILTRGTQAAIEEEAESVKIIAFSEINKDRQGANSDITELFKQLSEGGITVMKKDPMTNFKTVKKIKTEQKTLLYGTTEAANDEELETRYVRIPIRGSRQKNKIVVNSFLDSISSPEKILSKNNKKQSWIAEGLTLLDDKLQVSVPFSNMIGHIFDMNEDRIKRDVKRLLALTKAITWLHQKQRKIVDCEGVKFVISQPCDFLMSIYLFSDFFSLSYSGLDHRILGLLETINENKGKHTKEVLENGYSVDYSDWCLKHRIREATGLAKTTMDTYLNQLAERNLIERYFDRNICSRYSLVKCAPQSAHQVRTKCVSVDKAVSTMGALEVHSSTHEQNIHHSIHIRDFREESSLYNNPKKEVQFLNFNVRIFPQKVRTSSVRTKNTRNIHVELEGILRENKKPIAIEKLYDMLKEKIERSKFDTLLQTKITDGILYQPKAGEVALL